MPPKFSREMTIPIVHGNAFKNQFRTSPCEDRCPLGTSIQKVQSLVEKKEFTEALRYLRAKNPFPGITGRVCPHFCMDKCNRQEKDACVNIRAVERAVASYGDEFSTIIKKRESTGKKIAIIGGGPAGLSAAYYASLLGHSATIFEAQPLLGGVPRYGVPSFRLPRYIVDNEVGMVLQTGVKAFVNTKVGVDISFKEIKDRFDALIVATGVPLENTLPLKGAEYATKGVEFLRDVTLGNKIDIGKKVVVMGGGGVAFDCAISAARNGASEVHIICLESADKMLAPEEDLILARELNIKVHNCCTMAEITIENDKIKAVNYNKVEKHYFDESGRLKLELCAGGPDKLACDTVIFAVGMKTDLSFLKETPLVTTAKNWLEVDSSQKTSDDNIFAAGDVSAGPASIARAIGDGRKAAFSVHEKLTGEKSRIYALDENNIIQAYDELGSDTLPEVIPYSEVFGETQYEKSESIEDPRAKCADLFDELFETISENEASKESSRCMHCGHCKSCKTCVLDCPGYIIEMVPNQEGVEHPQVMFKEECWHCANCRTSCPCGAIVFDIPLYMQV